MHVLVHDGKAVQVAATPFPVAQGLQWIEVAYAVEPGWLYTDGQLVPPVEPPALTFDEHRAALLSDVDQIAKHKRDAIVTAYSPAEMASWPIKRAEALAWQASGNDADAPNLVIEAQARQTELADLVARVLAKSATLAQIEALTAGHTGYLQDQIRAVADGDEAWLAAIDIHAGWPV